MRAGGYVDQLASDTDPIAALAHRAFEHVANAKLAPDLLHIDRLPLVGEGRIASDHEQPGNAGKRGDDFLDHAVDEIFLLRVARHVLEGKTAIDGLSGSGKTATGGSATGLSARTR